MKLQDASRFFGLCFAASFALVAAACDNENSSAGEGVRKAVDARVPPVDAGPPSAGEGGEDAAANGGSGGKEPAAGSGGDTAAAAGSGGQAGEDATGAGRGAGRGAEAGSGGAAGSGGMAGGGSEAGSGGSEAGSGGSEAGSGGSAGSQGGSGGSAGSEAGNGGSGGSAGAQAGSGGSGGAQGGSGGGPAAGSGGEGGAGGSAGAPPPGRCGTRGGVECAAEQFCDFAPDVDCGATDRGGLCEDVPRFCAAIFAPVCGCDNRTYASECNAHAAGVSVKHQELCTPEECTAAGGRPRTSTGANIPQCDAGELSWSISGGIEPVVCCLPRPKGATCGGIANLRCNDREFCNYEVAAGGQGCDGKIADAAGVCEETPSFCTREFNPVCGCDHRSYANTCDAHFNGVAILHEGACTEVDCAAVAGRVVYSTGLPPMCAATEEQYTYVVDSNGALPVESAICCVRQM